MLKSYFTIALRNLLKEKVYSLIKIAGFSFGLAASMIIYLFVREDLSFDKFHTKHERIVRVLTIDNAEGVSSKLVGVTQPRLGPAAAEELAEVEQSVRITGSGRYDLSYEGNALKCEAAFRVDPSIFEVFDFKVIDGPSRGILDQPGSIAITTTLAKKIFGDTKAIGKTIKLNQSTDLNVAAVLADPPKNSHLQFDLLHTLIPGQNEDGLRQALDTWQSIFCFTYLLLDKPVDESILNASLQAIARKNNAYEFFTPVTQRLDDIHLKSRDVLFETNAHKTDEQNVYVLSTIAILILLLAAVNFTNLVTAKSTARAKEVGMRKVIGAVRSQLIGQHLTESIVITLLSAIIALAITYFTVPYLNNAYQRNADLSVLRESGSITVLMMLVLGVGILAGIYPAFVLSSFRPVVVLKGAFKNTTGGLRLRKTLVVLQFTISIALMVGTGIVFRQMKFIYTTDLGYNREQVITIQQSGAAVGRATTFRTELLRNENIVSAGTASTRIGQQLGRTNIFPEGSTNEANIITSVMAVDESFIPTMGLKILQGRNFSLDFDDSLSMIINEEMARLLKWENSIGRKISLQSGATRNDLTSYTVVGVVNDFHFATIRHKLEPMFMLYNANNGSLAVRISRQNIPATIDFIKETWNKVNTGSTFEYNFLDEQFAALYRNEQAFAAMFTHFTVLGIVIACLGLFALSAFTAEQRKKEIGIRKVLGASNGTIFFKLSAEFIRLIAISFLFACVSGYYMMDKWLDNFEYSIDIGADIFLIAGALSFTIALLTISFQALRAAFTNPVDSLRVE